ncbi:MAG: class II glutamine amidotransferase [Candidatus Dormibacteraceae bacterium]
MCELLLVRWSRPEPFSRSLGWALELERLGVAGFGWGVAWLEDGRVRVEKDPGRLGDDEGAQARLAGLASDRFLVHLRRPSQLSTVSIHDTQPFVASGFAFCHNGTFARHRELRPRFEERLLGHADSEVGFRLFEELLGDAEPAAALERTHRELGGDANLAYLGEDGTLVAYNGHDHNDLWTFELDGAEVAATALHSADTSLFDLVFTGATNRLRLRGEAAALEQPQDVGAGR